MDTKERVIELTKKAMELSIDIDRYKRLIERHKPIVENLERERAIQAYLNEKRQLDFAQTDIEMLKTQLRDVMKEIDELFK